MCKQNLYSYLTELFELELFDKTEYFEIEMFFGNQTVYLHFKLRTYAKLNCLK